MSIIIRFSVLFNFMYFAFPAQGQELRGVIMDDRTNERLPYANVVIKGTVIGTISKEDGTFVLDVSDKPKKSDSVTFSMIGYHPFITDVLSARDSMVVRLKPQSFKLDPVLVSPRTPEEMIQLAIDRIPDNYTQEPYNATIHFRTMVRLNGKYIESTEALMQGYIMPITGYDKDTTRLRLLAMKYFDEQELAMKSVVSRKRKKKGDKLAIEGLDTMIVDMSKALNEYFGIYTQIDSNLIKQFHEKGYADDGVKFSYGNMVENEGRSLIKIQYKGRIKGVAQQKGNLLIEEESLAFEAFNYKIESSSLRLKLLLMLAGLGFKSFDVVLGFNCIPTAQGWIPQSLTTHAFVDMEKNKWFAKDIPLVMELSSQLNFLEIDFPATDKCNSGPLVRKKKALSEQFESNPEHPAWKKYADKINGR